MVAGKMKVHYSSKTDNWATPQWLFDKLNAIYDFDLDVCANSENAKFWRYYSPDDDGLKQTWTGRIWMNPPYGRTIGRCLTEYTCVHCSDRYQIDSGD